MCGIAAIIGDNEQNSKNLQEILLAIAHRGEKEYFNEHAQTGHCVLGMNRLAIVDREHAKQPVSSSDEIFSIVFNGEIYNYKELQAELKALGYTFRTDSDTEVLVNGFAEWGVKLVDKLDGMFAFIIYDRKRDDFFVARDPLGIKPLYWAKDTKNTFYFASEIKGLSGVDTINEIQLLPPGHYMQKEKLQQYFFLPTTIDKNITEEAVKNIRELIDHSVRIRVQTDLPIAVYLSGGIDSTAILATARKFHNNVTAIILGNEQSTDRNFAVQYCEENTIPYIVHTPASEEELVKHISEIVHITESFEPNMIRQAAVSYYIAKTAAEGGFKVILCGEGADELFAGYPEFTACSTEEEIEQTVLRFLQDLHRTQLQRVDRTSMAFTTEVRVPFLDKHLVEYALQLAGGLKIRKMNNKTITKYILRKAMSDRLPSSIYNRDKVVLSEGAGFKGNQRIGGLFYDSVTKQITDEEFAHWMKKYPQWNLQTKEELYYFREYVQYGYTKATFNQKRTTVNTTDTEKADARLAKTILDTFNTWKYKREQPNTEEKINQLILKQITENKPISFVMYWGKGDRNSISDIEDAALQYVSDMLKPIQQIYKQYIQLTLVLTDTHAELNGYSTVTIQGYFDSVRTLVAEYDFIETILMSELVPYQEEILLQVAGKIADADIPNVFYSSSEKHFQKYSDVQLGAKLYYLQNQIEKSAIEKHFSDCIFMTYNSSKWDGIHPIGLPIFHMYSLKKGTSVKPWFVDSTD